MGAPVIAGAIGLASRAVADETDLVARVRAGDEEAFAAIVREHHPRLVRLAESVVGSRAVAEEVAQETWLAVVRGIDRFEGRSSFKTWLFHILLNRARTAAGRERRTEALPEGEPVERFTRLGGWQQPPVPWSDLVDDRIVAERLAVRVREALPGLPDAQRQVLVLRDLEGVASGEVAALLGITEGHQRVLLHRARGRIRQHLEAEMGTA